MLMLYTFKYFSNYSKNRSVDFLLRIKIELITDTAEEFISEFGLSHILQV